ncbi:hypothetical protein [Enterococcus faecalis]|uniref:hypothetical protein n=1 Tax=Enterococcus faecalis TaxID=1351 RepID=UPI001CE06A34|nr:hypothetical protein [Enterococcus faecalis]
MLEDMYPKAVEAGIAAERFWGLSYEELIIQVRANAKIHQRELEEQAMLTYKQAQLNAYGMNEPKKMPKFQQIFPFVQVSSEIDGQEETSIVKQQDWRVMKARMQEQAEMIKATRRRQNQVRKEE